MHSGKWKKVFQAVCLLIFIHVVRESVDKHSVSFREYTRGSRVWLEDTKTVSELLRKELHIQTSDNFHGNFSNLSYTLPLDAAKWRQNPRLQHVNCKAMFEGNDEEIRRAKEIMSNNRKDTKTASDYIRMTSNCESFVKNRGYITQPLSKEEHEFPIAFSILVYGDIEQVERLLRAIYMPQNYYCLHVDTKAPDVMHRAVRSIVRCFPNVFVASRLERVFWGHISVVRAEMNCLQDLLQYHWKYFINLSGQMFPLHSNRDLIKILTLYDGANDIEGSYERSRPYFLRTLTRFRLYESFPVMLWTAQPKGRPPHNAVVYKGSNQAAVSRAFALYFMHSPVAKDLVDWFSDTFVPDESIWPTLNHNAHLLAPGAYKGDPEVKTFTARATIWGPKTDQINWSWKHWECQGKWVRSICIFGVGDLPWLYQRPELFANKFHDSFEWLAYDCLEELIFNRTLDRGAPFNATYYQNLPFVKHKEQVVSIEDAAKGSTEVWR